MSDNWEIGRRQFIAAWLCVAAMAITACAGPSKERVRKAYDSIPQPEGAVLIAEETFEKPGFFAIQRTFSGNALPDAIQQHYDTWLKRMGWSFERVQVDPQWNAALGGWTSEYCKESLRASVQYAGTATDQWSHAFTITASSTDPICRKRLHSSAHGRNGKPVLP